MSRKYHVKHGGNSHYGERLQARGVSSAQVRMPFFDKRQKAHNTVEEMTRANLHRGYEAL